MEGNQMKMREALVAVQKKIEYLCGSFNVPNSLVATRMEINGIINAALAAPARNCDLPFCVEGVTWDNADKAWRAFKQNHLDAYFDAPGLIRCIEWLLAPAEKGGAK